MRKTLLLCLSSVIGSLAAVLLLCLSLGVDAGAPSTAGQNGDTNGDGDIDISDAIHLLLHLFRGGEPPVSCADPPELLARVAELEAALSTCQADLSAATASAAALAAQVEDLQAEFAGCRARRGLPDTGQSFCSGFVESLGWTAIPCGEAACQGQDGSHATGCPSEGRFMDNADGTVTDTCTGLQWQQNTADVNGDGQIPDDGSDFLHWCDGLTYCETLKFADHDDWRLPNVRELQSIVDYGRVSPSIDPVFGALSAVYWSSSADASYPGYAWSLDFRIGTVRIHDFDENATFYLRAVRGP